MEERANKNEREKIQNEGGRVEVIAKYFLLTMLLSFLGWTFEIIVTYFSAGGYYDRGLLTLPVCPIYGISLMTVYFLLGTPSEGRGLLKNVVNPFTRYSLYVVFAFLVPTVAELLVGVTFDAFFHTSLWSYAWLPMNFRGYISLPVSLGWAALILLFMRYLFEPIKRLVFKLPKILSIALAITLFITIIFDFALSMSALR